VVGWHTEGKKAFRVKLGGGPQVTEFAFKLEAPEDGDPDSGMVAVWSDGSTSVLRDYCLRDHEAATAMMSGTRVGKLPAVFSEKMGDKMIEVRPRKHTTPNKKLQDMFVILENGVQFGQLIINDTMSHEDAKAIMIEAASLFVQGKLAKAEVKKFKDERARAMGKVVAKSSKKTPLGKGDASVLETRRTPMKVANTRGSSEAAAHAVSGKATKSYVEGCMEIPW